MNKNDKIELIERIGIDKTVIGNIVITDIDFTKLQEKMKTGNITLNIESAKQAYYILESGEMFSYLKILDNNLFGDFIAGVKINKGTTVKYAKMSIPIRKGNNLQNMTCKEYHARIKEIFRYLEREYGITADYSEIKLCELEINTTFTLELGKFKDYSRVFLMFVRNVPNNKYGRKRNVEKSNKQMTIQNNNVIYNTFYEADLELQEDRLQTLYVGNNEIELKIYDKGQQLHNIYGLDMPNNIIRIEFTLKSDRKIRSIFNTTHVSAMTDEKIKTFFVKQFSEDIINQYDKWYKINQKNLIKLLNKHFNIDDRRMWIPNFLREVREYESTHNVPLIFDINDLKVPLKTISKNPDRTLDNIVKEASKYENDLMDNKKKLDEIKEKILNMKIQ